MPEFRSGKTNTTFEIVNAGNYGSGGNIGIAYSSPSSAVSMSVGQKDGATQIVKDWLSTESGSENSDGSEEEK